MKGDVKSPNLVARKNKRISNGCNILT